MSLKDKVNEVIKSGITPIVFNVEPVRFFNRDSIIFRSFMVINSLELGTLTYKQYRFVARRTKQGEHMVKRHIHKMMRFIPDLLSEYPGVECFTIPVYARLLKDSLLANMLLEAFTLFPKVSADMICIELSADILYENVDEARIKIDELRNLGVRVAISEVGDEFCPVFRLSDIQFDYAFLDEFAIASLLRPDADRVVGSLVKFIHYLDIDVVAPGLKTEREVEIAGGLGCDGFTSESFIYPSVTKEVSDVGAI